jgi:hypothetical protein
MIVSELNYCIHDVSFRTDSMSIIRYIAKKKTLFHTSVANRLGIIHEATGPKQWNYIDTKQNPADLASRGRFSVKRCIHWQVSEKKCNRCMDQISYGRKIKNGRNVVKVWTFLPTMQKLKTQWVNECQQATESNERMNAYCTLVLTGTIAEIYIVVIMSQKSLREFARPKVSSIKLTKTSQKPSIHLTVDFMKQAEHGLFSYVQRNHFTED